jgi:hypothetical protein
MTRSPQGACTANVVIFDNPTTAEKSAIQAPVAKYQAMFDTH